MAIIKRVTLPEVTDGRGCLMFAEVDRHIPFDVMRIFAIYGVAEGQQRAGHAHRTNHQFIVTTSGSCTVVIDDGERESSERLDKPTLGLHVPPLVWITLKDFSYGAVCLVLASEHYDPAEYIRDLAEFRRLVQNNVIDGVRP